MAKKKSEVRRHTAMMRVDEEALGWARIASGYTGESMADYVSRIVKERAKEDARRLHAERFGGEPPGPGPKGKGGPAK